ncbi:MAG TPA: sugar ABC transporter permease [Ktedonobacterales bacterium]|nr:sugar ABC transporter permease [Ktedonobacterales bacterium]
MAMSAFVADGHGSRRRWRPALGNLGTNMLFLGPALLLFTLFIIYPVLSSVGLSFTNWDGISQQLQSVGLVNYQSLLTDNQFWPALEHTLIFTVAVMIIQNGLGLGLALCLQRFTRGTAFLRVLFLIPMLLSSVAIGYIWSYIYEPGPSGGLNTFLGMLHLTGLEQDWLGNSHLALGSIIATMCWQWTGFSMIVFLAGLQLIPHELYEAADVDGANDWQRFRHITFPMLAPAMTVNILLSTIGCLRTFDIIYVMTSGGPNGATETIIPQIYRIAFSENQFGYATTVSVAFFVLMLALSVSTLLLLRRREATA